MNNDSLVKTKIQIQTVKNTNKPSYSIKDFNDKSLQKNIFLPIGKKLKKYA